VTLPETFDPRITAVVLKSVYGSALFACVLCLYAYRYRLGYLVSVPALEFLTLPSPGCSFTSQAVFTLSMLLCFVDFMKAFNSVNC